MPERAGEGANLLFSSDPGEVVAKIFRGVFVFTGVELVQPEIYDIEVVGILSRGSFQSLPPSASCIHKPVAIAQVTVSSSIKRGR